MARLMTPTMWDSIDFLEGCPSSWRERAYQGLSDTLNRVWNSNPAVERGMAFEDVVCKTDSLDEFLEKVNNTDIEDKLTKAYNMVHAEGHDFQHKVKKIIKDNRGNDYLLYGREDVSFEPKILDLKTTARWKGNRSYLGKWQHKVYCYADNKTSFTYIVFVFDDSSSEPGKGPLVDVKFIDYTVTDMNMLHNMIKDKLESVLAFFRKNPKLKDAYLHKFCLY